MPLGYHFGYYYRYHRYNEYDRDKWSNYDKKILCSDQNFQILTRDTFDRNIDDPYFSLPAHYIHESMHHDLPKYYVIYA